MKTKTTDNELMAIQMSYTELTKRFLDEGFDEFACAAIMTKLALMIYKSALNEEEYNLMIDEISASRNHIKSFQESDAEVSAQKRSLN